MLSLYYDGVSRVVFISVLQRGCIYVISYPYDQCYVPVTDTYMHAHKCSVFKHGP